MKKYALTEYGKRVKELEKTIKVLTLETARLKAENEWLTTENENLKAKVQEVFGYYMMGKRME